MRWPSSPSFPRISLALERCDSRLTADRTSTEKLDDNAIGVLLWLLTDIAPVTRVTARGRSSGPTAGGPVIASVR